MSDLFIHHLRDEERSLLLKLRRARHAPPRDPTADYTLGENIADKVAAGMGSWPFIIVQSTILLVWIILNVAAWMHHWDPYPFILLNLALSFQAAYAAPFIMMSQNRQAAIDRRDAKNDYNVNIKAELEIELLHEKIDKMRQEEISRLTTLVEELAGKLATIATQRG